MVKFVVGATRGVLPQDPHRDAHGVLDLIEQRDPPDHDGSGAGTVGALARSGWLRAPASATLNMNGTAVRSATVLFLAQVFGVELSLGQQLVVVLMSVVTAIGVAGIPSGSIPC